MSPDVNYKYIFFLEIWNFSSGLQLDISQWLVRWAQSSWDIELNTREKFQTLRAIVLYSLCLIATLRLLASKYCSLSPTVPYYEGPLYFLREAWLGLFFSRETWFKLLLIRDSWFTVKISFHVRVNAIFDFNVSRERRVELNVIRERTCSAWNNFRLFM